MWCSCCRIYTRRCGRWASRLSAALRLERGQGRNPDFRSLALEDRLEEERKLIAAEAHATYRERNRLRLANALRFAKAGKK